MILIKDAELRPRRVFDAVRTTVQELHPELSFSEDTSSSPLLFKSANEEIWVRVFYQPMRDVPSHELRHEIEKLKMLTAKDSLIYFFYPELDSDQIVALKSVYPQLAFFEYAGMVATDHGAEGIKVCKWVPTIEVPHTDSGSVRVLGPDLSVPSSSRFLQYARLTQEEMSELIELGFTLKQSFS